MVEDQMRGFLRADTDSVEADHFAGNDRFRNRTPRGIRSSEQHGSVVLGWAECADRVIREYEYFAARRHNWPTFYAAGNSCGLQNRFAVACDVGENSGASTECSWCYWKRRSCPSAHPCGSSLGIQALSGPGFASQQGGEKDSASERIDPIQKADLVSWIRAETK